MISQKKVLVFDYDGTINIGTISSRKKLLDFIKSNNCSVILNTGRNKNDMMPNLSDPFLPKIDYYICDLGCAVYDSNFNEIDLWDYNKIQKPKIVEIYKKAPFVKNLKRQDIATNRRVSFYLDSKKNGNISKYLIKIIKKYDVVISDDKYVDFLPKGINKGSSLSKLLVFLKINPNDVYAFGDSNNDYSMLTMFENSVVLPRIDGTFDSCFKEKKVKSKNINGVDGIIEFLEKSAKTKKAILYIKPPNINSHPNGILKSIFSAKDDIDCYFSLGISDKNDYISESMINTTKLYILNISKQEYLNFYHYVSHGILWPTFHGFTFKQMDNSRWNTFLETNKKLAILVSKQLNDYDNIWIHDYNLIPTIGYLKKINPKLRVGYYHHIPWLDSFISKLDKKGDLVWNLKYADVVAMHIPKYLNELQKSYSDITHTCSTEMVNIKSFPRKDQCLSVEQYVKEINFYGHKQKLFPIPLESDFNISEIIKVEKDKLDLEKLEIKISLISRLDYTKGIKEFLCMINELVVTKFYCNKNIKLSFMIVLAEPAYIHLYEYSIYKESIKKLYADVKGLIRRQEDSSINIAINEGMNHEELNRVYKETDILVAPSIFDGLNMTVKEFYKVKNYFGHNNFQVLVSNTTGVAYQNNDFVTFDYKTSGDFLKKFKVSINNFIQNKNYILWTPSTRKSWYEHVWSVL